MKILVIHNQKGGVGKTLISTHAAWHFAAKGRRVVLLDADSQANSTAVMAVNQRIFSAGAFLSGDVTAPESADSLTVIPADQALSGLKRAGTNLLAGIRGSIEALKEHFDLMVVDTGPDDSTVNISLLCVATHVLAPIDLSEHSVQGMKSLLQRIVGVRQRLNPGLDFVGILVNGLDRTKTSHRAKLDELSATYSTKYFLPYVLSHRNAFHQSASARRPVWEDRKRAAAEAAREMRAALDHVDERMFRHAGAVSEATDNVLEGAQ